MIIKRLAEGIKNQDWFVVIVEVTIVVVGIFIGLQVDDWNQDRKERNEEQLYVARLIVDTKASIKEMEEILVLTKSKRLMATKGVELLRNKAVTPDNMEEFSATYTSMFGWQKMNFRTDTIEELISTGRLLIFRSPEFRSIIAHFRTNIDLYEKRSILLGNSIMSLQKFLSSNIMMDPTYQRIIDTASVLNENKILYNNFNSVNNLHNVLFQYSKLFHQQSKHFLEDLTNMQKVMSK